MKKVLLSCALAGALFGLELDGFSTPEGSLITEDAFYIANRGKNEDSLGRNGFISSAIIHDIAVSFNILSNSYAM